MRDGSPKIISLLGDLLASEFAAMNTCFVNARLLETQLDLIESPR